MRKKDVVIGGVYEAKVSGRICPVKILSERPYGGWAAENLLTHRRIVVRSAARLRRRLDVGPSAHTWDLCLRDPVARARDPLAALMELESRRELELERRLMGVWR